MLSWRPCVLPQVYGLTFCFANQYLLAISCWLTWSDCRVTVFAAVQVLMIVELAKTGKSIAFKGVSRDGIDSGTLIFDGNTNSFSPKP